MLNPKNKNSGRVLAVLAFLALSLVLAENPAAQEPPQKPAAKPKSPTSSEAPLPAQFSLLETHLRFEANGDSRKEIHAVVKINNEIGVRQFARLSFDFNRAFERIEIPVVRITHASGGMADILPSAISDEPNPTVVTAPDYQDIRVKSVRILGLAPSDTLEYRVVTTATTHPLAPDFWFEHSFERTGVVAKEIFELSLPASREVQTRFNPATPPASKEKSGEGDATRTVYRWQLFGAAALAPLTDDSPDLTATTFPTWDRLSARMALDFLPRMIPQDDVKPKVAELTREATSAEEKLELLYDFVAQKIRTVDLPLGSLGYSPRPLAKIIESGYASAEEKSFLLAALCEASGSHAKPVLVSGLRSTRDQLPSPAAFTKILVRVGDPPNSRWLDPALEVAPFGAIQANLRGTRGLLIVATPENVKEADGIWPAVASDLPFVSLQKVTVDATLAGTGTLNAKVKYVMRGDNELLLRVAFHQTPRDNWKNVAQLLSLSDGFRGQISNVVASDPFATKEPFTVEYEIAQPKFVNWSKKPVTILPLLPLLGLPEPPARAATGAPASSIELGTPLDVELSVTLHVPAKTTARLPAGTSVKRDFATFSSQYAANDSTLTASRHLNFILRELPAERTADFSAFLRAVQNDESQTITLDRPEAVSQSQAKP